MHRVSGTVRLPILAAVVAALNLFAVSCATAEVPSLPATMRAAAIDRGGDAETLSIHQLPVPVPSAGEVLIAVKAAGVGVWQAKYRPRDSADTHFPVILGSDGTGIIAALGAGVQGFKVGDAVYGTDGSFYAEYAAVSARNVASVPPGVKPTEAAI